VLLLLDTIQVVFKGQGHQSRVHGHEENVARVIGATLSEGFAGFLHREP